MLYHIQVGALKQIISPLSPLPFSHQEADLTSYESLGLTLFVFISSPVTMALEKSSGHLAPSCFDTKATRHQHYFEKRGFKIKPYKPENSTKAFLGSEGRDSMKLPLSPLVKILIGNLRHSKKRKILLC